MQHQSDKQPEGKGPLAEIDFWRQRSAVICGLWEQLNTRAAEGIVSAVEAGSDDVNLMSAFKSQLAELGKLAHEVRACACGSRDMDPWGVQPRPARRSVLLWGGSGRASQGATREAHAARAAPCCCRCQARDNVKFLATLERHFRSISTGPLAGILDTLPLLLNALRMVWIISRYYSDDDHMTALFARIGTELCDRVDNAVMLHTLFRMPADEAVELLRVSKAVLESWQANYMQVRRGCVLRASACAPGAHVHTAQSPCHHLQLSPCVRGASAA
jgi:hypothetical protein